VFTNQKINQKFISQNKTKTIIDFILLVFGPLTELVDNLEKSFESVNAIVGQLFDVPVIAITQTFLAVDIGSF